MEKAQGRIYFDREREVLGNIVLLTLFCDVVPIAIDLVFVRVSILQ